MQLHLPSFLAELNRLDARLLVVSFAHLPRLQAWLPHFYDQLLVPYYQENSLVLPTNPLGRTRFVSDPKLQAYHAYGLGRNSIQQVYGTKILWQYLRWGLQGKKIRRPAEDTLQRGGDFVVNRANRLTFAHTGRDQSDRPAPASILAALAQ